MREYNLTVSSPDGNIFCGNVVAVYARGIEGDLAILAGHAPFVTFLKPCEVRIEFNDLNEIKGKVDGGILSVSDNGVILQSSSFRMI
ncbi:MAG: hypothetical protein IKJ59_05480 [Clostridia bacterium]|nr:hypothetical protein [Clostridia bacterium]MBR5786539.1 hypothetical protein [Clostridia bacterium]